MPIDSRRRGTAASIGLALFALALAGCGVAADPARIVPGPTASSPWSDAALPVASLAAVQSADQAGASLPLPSTSSPDPTLGPTPKPVPPKSFWFDTSVVGNFAEPPAGGRDHAGKFYSDHNYWAFCGAGAARVALEFAGKGPGWVAGKWPLTTYIEPWTSATGTRSSWKDGELSDQGRGYMMYLAIAVQPPSFKVPGVVTFGMKVDETGGSVVGTTVAQAAAVLNWEASGHKGEIGYFAAQTSNVTPEAFYRALEQEIGVDGYPALVSVLTAGYWAQGTRWTLPNWVNRGIPHWITVVGYDAASFYYVDTCWRSTGCGPRDPILTGAHPGTWAIPKYTLYEAMVSGYGGYVAPTVK